MTDEPVDNYDFFNFRPQAPIDPELSLRRAAEWRRRFLADHDAPPTWGGDSTFWLVTELADALEKAIRQPDERTIRALARALEADCALARALKADLARALEVDSRGERDE